MSHEYMETHVTVRLAKETHTVIVPKIPKEFQKLLESKYVYTLYASSQQHTVSFSDGLSLVLINSRKCTWVLHSDIVDFDSVEFPAKGQVAFANTLIFQNSPNASVYITDNKGGQLMVNPQTAEKLLSHITQTGSMTSQDIEKYLNSMDSSWLQMQQFVSISNYTVDGHYIGNAYYIVKEKKIVYTDFQGLDISNHFRDTLELLGHVNNYSYFMGTEGHHVVLWRTDPTMQNVDVTYHLYCGNKHFEVSKVMEQEKGIVLMQKVFNVSLVYKIYRDTITLVGIDGKQEDIYQMGEACFPSINDYVPLLSLSVDTADQFPGTCVYATPTAVMPVVQHTGDTGRHYWLYMEDSDDQPKPSPGSPCPAIKPPRAKGVITPTLTDECEDLTLRDIQELNTSVPVYYFFCEHDKRLFYQVGEEKAREVFVPGGIAMIHDYGGPKLVESLTGGLYKFKATGNFSLAALSFEKVALAEQWKQKFHNISQGVYMETYLPIVEMNTKNNQSLTAWYDVAEDSLIIVSPSINAKDVLFIGWSPLPHLVWLYSQSKQQVFLQEVLDNGEIESLINRTDSRALWGSETLPWKEIALDGISDVELRHGGILAETKNGVKLTIDHFMGTTLRGVNSTWLSNQADDIDGSLLSLCGEYNSSALIYLDFNKSEEGDMVQNWYHCGLQKWISTDANTDSEKHYLGVNEAEKSLYIYDNHQILQYISNDDDTNTQGLQEQRFMAAKPFTSAEFAVSLGQSLTIQASVDSMLKVIPKLDNMNMLVLSTSAGSSITIEADTWLYYETIYVTSIGTRGSQISSLVVQPPDHCLHSIEEVGNNTIIHDPISPKTIILQDFTSRPIHFGSNGLPDDNSAVLRLTFCDQNPIFFMTNSPRLDAFEDTKDSTTHAPIITLITVALCCVLCLPLIIYAVVRIRNKPKMTKHDREYEYETETTVMLQHNDQQRSIKYKTFSQEQLSEDDYVLKDATVL